MSARAICPVCGRHLAVRSDERLPKHWWSARDQLSGGDRCEGSQMSTRNWPTTESGTRYQRPPRT